MESKPCVVAPNRQRIGAAEKSTHSYLSVAQRLTAPVLDLSDDAADSAHERVALGDEMAAPALRSSSTEESTGTTTVHRPQCVWELVVRSVRRHVGLARKPQHIPGPLGQKSSQLRDRLEMGFE